MVVYIRTRRNFEPISPMGCVSMAFLGLDRLLCLVHDPDIKLVENLSRKELESPEGTGFDLRVGAIFGLKGHGELLVDMRKTPEVECLSQDDSKPFVLEPNRYYLAKTIERVNLSKKFVGIIRPRSTLYRSGVLLGCGQVNPGYHGELTFGLFNAHWQPFHLSVGARIAHLLVAEVDGQSSPYAGQWQDGRVSAPSLEEQI